MSSILEMMGREYPRTSNLLAKRTRKLEQASIEKSSLKFSLIGPAVRKNQYQRIYDFFTATNSVPFEIMFVGYNPPDSPIASNFRYIETKVKYSQCLEIAAREAKGEYLILIGDDYEFSEGFIDGLNFYVTRSNLSESLVGYNSTLSNEFYRSLLVFDNKVKNTPICAGGGVYKKSVWHELGGIDKRFSGGLCNLDMQLRFQEAGHPLFIAPDIFGNETRDVDLVSSMWDRTGRLGRDLCKKLWVKDYLAVKKRLLPVESFDDKDILTVNQD